MFFKYVLLHSVPEAWEGFPSCLSAAPITEKSGWALKPLLAPPAPEKRSTTVSVTAFFLIHIYYELSCILSTFGGGLGSFSGGTRPLISSAQNTQAGFRSRYLDCNPRKPVRSPCLGEQHRACPHCSVERLRVADA